jgi:hypothetical protein
MPARIERVWSPKLTVSRISFSERATSSTFRIVPTRMSSASSAAKAMIGLMGPGVKSLMV